MFEIKLMGAISKDWGGKKRIEIDKFEDDKIHLKDLFIEIRKLEKEKFNIYFDGDLTPKRGTIIIINGIDYNVLGGINAEITSVDEIILVPTISGG